MADETQVLVQTLVERAQSGDGGAFGELYEQFAPEIFRYLLRHLNGRRESAEDLTEEVFLKVLERLGSYQFRGLPFSAWLYRIARNHMIDHLRSRPKQIVSSLDAAPEIPEKKAELVMDRSLDRHGGLHGGGRQLERHEVAVALAARLDDLAVEPRRTLGDAAVEDVDALGHRRAVSEPRAGAGLDVGEQHGTEADRALGAAGAHGSNR